MQLGNWKDNNHKHTADVNQTIEVANQSPVIGSIENLHSCSLA